MDVNSFLVLEEARKEEDVEKRVKMLKTTCELASGIVGFRNMVIRREDACQMREADNVDQDFSFENHALSVRISLAKRPFKGYHVKKPMKPSRVNTQLKQRKVRKRLLNHC